MGSCLSLGPIKTITISEKITAVKFLQPSNHKLCFRHFLLGHVSAIFRPWLRPVAWFFETRDFLVVNHQQMFRGQIASRFTEVSIVHRTK